MEPEENGHCTPSPDTIFVHGGEPYRASSVQGEPTVQPIYTSTTYHYADSAALESAFDYRTTNTSPVYIYAQGGNPNTHTLEQALTKIEAGVGAITTGSGMAAIHVALLAAGLKAGKKLLASRALYGTTLELIQTVFASAGIEIVLQDLCIPAKQLIQDISAQRPDVIYVESLSNPLLKMVDLEAISVAARQVGAITIVDNTFATPYLLRPLMYGFDMVVHSATKYLGGHGDSSAGILVCARADLLESARCSALMLGSALSPFEAYLVARGLKTLPLRMARHCQNALYVASFLAQHPAVARVYYPGLPQHDQHALAAHLLEHELFGGVVTFELREQSRAAVFRFLDRLNLCLPVTTLGDVFTEVCYPPMSSHRALSPLARRDLGISDGCVRLSVGIEDVQDIVQDLAQALV